MSGGVGRATAQRNPAGALYQTSVFQPKIKPARQPGKDLGPDEKDPTLLHATHPLLSLFLSVKEGNIYHAKLC